MRKEITLFILFCLGISIFLFSLSFISSLVTLNEIELNPPGTDSGNEWIELFSNETPLSLANWEIRSNNGRNMTLNVTFIDNYFTINTTTNLLTNDNNIIYLYDSFGTLVSQTPSLTDSLNNITTWQYCPIFNNWTFTAATFGYSNNCSTPEIPSDNNQTNNQTTNSSGNINNNNNSEPAKEYIQLDWDDVNLTNSEEFEITVNAFNLLDEIYDVKVGIQDGDTIITEFYDTINQKWTSSNYYFDSFFSSPGSYHKILTLRLREAYKNFTGYADVFGKLRRGSTIVGEFYGTIKILNSNNSQTNNSIISKDTIITSINNTENILRLNVPSNSLNETPANQDSIIYKSKNEYIKQYAFYAFSGLSPIILLIVLISLIKRIKRKEE